MWKFGSMVCSVYPLTKLDTIGIDGHTDWSSSIMYIINGTSDDHLDMLEGGVVRQLLNEKWRVFGYVRYDFYDGVLFTRGCILHLWFSHCQYSTYFYFSFGGSFAVITPTVSQHDVVFWILSKVMATKCIKMQKVFTIDIVISELYDSICKETLVLVRFAFLNLRTL